VDKGEKFITQVFFDWFKPRTQNAVHEVFKSVGLPWLEPLY